jgi:hypothetical protein
MLRVTVSPNHTGGDLNVRGYALQDSGVWPIVPMRVCRDKNNKRRDEA